MSNISVILLAGGLGLRMGISMPKQFLPLGDKLIAQHSYELFRSIPQINEIIVVCEPEYQIHFPNAKYALPGNRRQDSVYNGFLKISQDSSLVCIHDSARPFLSKDDLLKVIDAGQKHGAAALASPVKSTIKEGCGDHFVTKTLDRSILWELHTPQVVIPSLLKKGFEIAQDITVTDDVSLVELTGHPVKLVAGSASNIKITTPVDLKLAEILYEV